MVVRNTSEMRLRMIEFSILRADQVEHGRAGDEGASQVVLHEHLVQPVHVLHVKRPVQPQPVLRLLDLRVRERVRVRLKAASLEDLAPGVVVDNIPGGEGHETERPEPQQEQHHHHGEKTAGEKRGKGMPLAEPREVEWHPCAGGGGSRWAHWAFR